MTFDYFYGSQAERYSFYRVPRALIKDRRFKGLSSDAKLLYGLMLDRLALSMKNGWIDERQRAYIYYKAENIMEDLCVTKATCTKIMAELDSVKGIGLIERKRQGLGRPDIIYVKDFMTVSDDGGDRAMECPSGQGNPGTDTKKHNNHTAGGSDIELLAVQKTGGKKHEGQAAGSSDAKPLAVQKMAPNNNKWSHRDESHREDIHHSIMLDGSRKRRHSEDDVGRYMDLIRENIAYDHFMRYGATGEKELAEELYHLILDVVLVRRETVRIGSEEYPYEIVRSRFLKLKQPHIEYVMDAMRNNTAKVRNIRAYLLTALYNAPDTMNHYYRQEVNHDMFGGGQDEDDGCGAFACAGG